MLKKILAGFLFIFIALAVGLWSFWPENMIVHGPVLDFLTGKQLETPSEKTVANRLKLPDGFRVGVFATGVPHARMMRATVRGDLIVSSIREGNVILLHADDNGDGLSDGRTTLLSGLDTPHGLALQNGYLYVAETHRIIRAVFDHTARELGPVEVVFEGLPPGGNHSSRTIGFGPDGRLYVTIGSSCNVCIEDHPYRAAMLRMNADGTEAVTFASGLRNTVGFDWHPITGKLYGTDNGRDLLGDDIPHCELNLIEEGQFYGWPYTYDDKVVDPDFGEGHEQDIAASKEMVLGLGAHVAPLGIKFFDPDNTPAGYEGAALIALHGSWNRSVLSGYKVVSVHFGEDGRVEQRDFLTGFELDEDVIGRPVDMEQGPDGAIYISDDYAGTIYRVGWGNIAVSGQLADRQENANPLAGLSEEALRNYSIKGAALFAANDCATCHDPALAPEGVQVKLLDKLAGRFDVSGLMALLNTPPGPMPRPEINEEDRRALAIYLLANQ